MEIRQTLNELDRLLGQIDDDRDDFDEDYCQLHEMSRDEYEELLSRRGQTEFGKLWARYRQIMLELADHYLECSAERRRTIRQSVAELPDVSGNVGILVGELNWLIWTRDDATVLRRAVAILSIGDHGSDPACQKLLTDLHASSESASIDFDRVIKEVAALSSDEPTRPTQISTSRFFREFEPTQWPAHLIHKELPSDSKTPDET